MKTHAICQWQQSIKSIANLIHI